jgi:hypothetical protein
MESLAARDLPYGRTLKKKKISHAYIAKAKHRLFFIKENFYLKKYLL